ncbi:peptidoglycan DD-metalloendopeptidase family protein [Nitrosomonas sp. PY1]|uniref:peptidoglycan DD-metalloendopeptidase family protein n=1 Tax=Nitrosomonas sp. PY1 TaxID=1803906 RepID=UPI001FC7F61F|nr:peptidoglycan DD-metalloendopeptidase family protein [Nitrosomonas sp. PY1]
MTNSLGLLTINKKYRDATLKIFGGLISIKKHNLPFWVAIFYLIGCSTTQKPAPVVDRERVSAVQSGTSRIGDLTNQYHIVQRGDTLHSIGTTHGIDVQKLAEWNNISDPRSLKIGQRLNLYIPKPDSQPTLYALTDQPIQSMPESVPSSSVAMPPENAVSNASVTAHHDNIKRTPKAIKLPYSEQNMAQLKRSNTQAGMMPMAATSSAAAVSSNNTSELTTPPVERNTRIVPAPSAEAQKNERTSHDLSADWIWPANGKILSTFSKNSKGVKISGQLGEAVLASASGAVVYSGNGLRGYGNLIIIKHNDTYLSAYAHNSKILVKEGDSVTKGQKIAEMGNTDSDTVQLHFEIRKNGKPVDPLTYLPNPS